MLINMLNLSKKNIISHAILYICLILIVININIIYILYIYNYISPINLFLTNKYQIFN